MSFYQIFTIANRLRQQAIDKTLTLEIFFNTPKSPTIARQNNEYITHFLIDHIKEIIEIAIGEKAGAPPNIVNTAMELLLFPSISLLEFLSKNEIIINHIISRMINQEEVNVFFINAVKILIFIITSSNGTILNQIKDQTVEPPDECDNTNTNNGDANNDQDEIEITNELSSKEAENSNNENHIDL